MSRWRSTTTAPALLDQRQPEPPHLARVVSATCTRSSGNGIAASISTGIGHGVRGRLLRLIRWGASEADVLQAHEGALNASRSLVYMPVRDEMQRARVADALRSSGGRHLLHFRLWRLSSCPVASLSRLAARTNPHPQRDLTNGRLRDEHSSARPDLPPPPSAIGAPAALQKTEPPGAGWSPSGPHPASAFCPSLPLP